MDFQAVELAGHPGVARAACGFVDAAVIVGRRAYVLALRTNKHQPGGPTVTLVQLAGAMTFDPG